MNAAGARTGGGSNDGQVNIKHNFKLQETGRVQSYRFRFQVETRQQGCRGERSADGKRAAAMDAYRYG
jgi:hypothetical protein